MSLIKVVILKLGGIPRRYGSNHVQRPFSVVLSQSPQADEGARSAG